jgi:hypothetical protein
MSDDFFNGLEKIRRNYLQNIYQEAVIWIERIGSKDQILESDIRTYAHQIYGSGASYGFDFITDTGKKISDMLNHHFSMEQLIPLLQQMSEQILVEQKKII